MDIEDQLDTINPKPKTGGNNIWYPPSRQVSDEGLGEGQERNEGENKSTGQGLSGSETMRCSSGFTSGGKDKDQGCFFYAVKFGCFCFVFGIGSDNIVGMMLLPPSVLT